jgi:uncharacterized protein YwgA
MNAYQLAKIVHWAGTVKSRKRLQKVVYLLQAAGCPLGEEFTLHHFGPYSHGVAALVDEMVAAGLLVEQEASNPRGRQFDYRLTPRAADQLRAMDSSLTGNKAAKTMSAIEPLGCRLLKEVDTPELEVASTIAYFKLQGRDWEEAVLKTAEFKALPHLTATLQHAEKLAREVLKSR